MHLAESFQLHVFLLLFYDMSLSQAWILPVGGFSQADFSAAFLDFSQPLSCEFSYLLTAVLARQHHCWRDGNEIASTGTISLIYFFFGHQKSRIALLCAPHTNSVHFPQGTLGPFLTILNVYSQKNNLTITIFKMSVLWCENFD